jgi:DUF1680 family protein
VTFPPGDRFFMYSELGYRQDQQAVDMTRAVGHAVRATYPFAGLPDAATIFGDAAYGSLDVFERTLYNGYLSGVSMAGDTFFSSARRANRAGSGGV